MGASAALLGWNNLGMHCMDSDYSVFSILPPYNTIEAQLIVGGRLVTNGYTVTYQAVADPEGSFNSTAMGKGNFYANAGVLYGATPGPEMGLAGWAMPGLGNTPQSMRFESVNQPAAGVLTPVNWFRAEGIPLSPYDDAGRKNPYPLMRLIARNAANQPIATNDIVLPVSDEMDCRICHASGTHQAAKPSAGWIWSELPERDYRLNILKLHDERQFSLHSGLYAAALADRGMNPQGLYRRVTVEAKAVLCAACHASEALGTGSYSNIPPLTASVHSKHAAVLDPVLNITLDSSANRSACYRCHPGSTTRCLRGAMGGAVAADGTLAMQCQSCHGNLSQVGSSKRVGWFMEPNCQSCHSGTATSNNGQIRFTSAFETNGLPRVAVDQTFATQPNTPAAGLSLYRFSAGHGGLQCSACHGSTHAEFPGLHRNDNVRSLASQGHVGMSVECTACHASMPNTVSGGPHGLHPLGQGWVNQHGDVMEGGASLASCQGCHGLDYTGSVLSRAQADRTFSTKYGIKTYQRRNQVGCYDCHNGPYSNGTALNAPPTVGNVSAMAPSGGRVLMILPGNDVNPLTYRIANQPASGTVGISNNVATYHAEAGFVGTVTFDFVASDGYSDSHLGTGTVAVVQSAFGVTATALAPTNYPAGWAVPFTVAAIPVNINAAATFAWIFGDGSPVGSSNSVSHVYSLPGTYQWSVVSSVSDGANTASTTNHGAIVIAPPATMNGIGSGAVLSFSWPRASAEVLLEQADHLDFGAVWTVNTNVINTGPAGSVVTVPVVGGTRFFRLRKL
jgi:PKD repeat protein